ncbi:MAG: glutamate synthase central domain-containing protein [Chthoniobacteraceae bacterium]
MKSTRTRIGLVLESGEPREVHHFCTLIGYGCGAINPYLAFETLDDMIGQGMLKNVDHQKACYNFVKAATKGVVKVVSKMGISTIQSYRGAQIFEAVGLSAERGGQVFHLDPDPHRGRGYQRHHQGSARCVTSTPSRIARRTATRSTWAASINGARMVRLHLFSPQTMHALQKSVRTGSYDEFKKYTALVDEQHKTALYPAWPARLQGWHPDSDRGSGVRRVDHQAFQIRRDELRLDQQGSA